MIHATVAASVEAAAQQLTDGVARALGGAGGTVFCLHDHVAGGPDVVAGLGAVRVLGADVLAPFVLGGAALGCDDIALLCDSVRAFPAPTPTADDPETVRLWGLRDWALSHTLAGLGVDVGGWIGLAEGADPHTEIDDGASTHWAAWAVELSQLSSLAFPQLHSPLRSGARERRLDLARGVTHALLRRDHLRAARLARWLALSAAEDRGAATEPAVRQVLAPALDHLDAIAVDQPRTLMEAALARCFLPEVVR
ncbi:hypothetical protein [Streptomyces alanosinicus]|uniref:hypothetical protein n=1 Tax=Streptomyces alanosinicus TaxID=68171 RepID=UPI00167C07D3|nr:hypothetical protein [Streptomyces alanosinicus]